jgi:FKBP-type peptidyl-prolyl cis-trans isomerase
MVTLDDRGSLINLHCTIGRRNAYAAIEYSLIGVKEGGYRKVKAKPHLAFRDAGIEGLVPKNAVVTFEIWLRSLQRGEAS